MNPVNAHDILNRLLILHKRSLPMYLADARPWRRPGNDRMADLLNQMVSDHRDTVERIGEMLWRDHMVPVTGEFPRAFTGWHDLSIEFLLGKLIERQRQLVSAIEQAVADLTGHPEARAVAEETLGQARGHLDSLEELVQQPTA